LLLLLVITSQAITGCTQNKNVNHQSKTTGNVGGPCEGCEAVYECPVPFDQLNNVDTLPDFNDAGPGIEISGTIYQRDGKTPAKDVILYVYHTNQEGVYPKKGNEKGWASRHGFIRGWVKTDKDGSYKFYTLIPASYPDSKNPKHIHPTIKEPGINEYYIDEYLFEGDPYLENENQSRPSRGGNGVIKPVMKDGLLRATRDIVLGLNIPGYPVYK
jgi:protocatechuate 3,4-dioxygenase beta subunit